MFHLFNLGERYTDPEEKIEDYRDYMSYTLDISPECAVAEDMADWVTITDYDAFLELAQVLQEKKGTREEKVVNAYLKDLDDRKLDLFPKDITVPEHIRSTDIPITSRDPFFGELSKSVSKTMSTLLKAAEEKEKDEMKDGGNENQRKYRCISGKTFS